MSLHWFLPLLGNTYRMWIYLPRVAETGHAYGKLSWMKNEAQKFIALQIVDMMSVGRKCWGLDRSQLSSVVQVSWSCLHCPTNGSITCQWHVIPYIKCGWTACPTEHDMLVGGYWKCLFLLLSVIPLLFLSEYIPSTSNFWWNKVTFPGTRAWSTMPPVDGNILGDVWNLCAHCWTQWARIFHHSGALFPRFFAHTILYIFIEIYYGFYHIF